MIENNYCAIFALDFDQYFIQYIINKIEILNI